MTDVWQPNTTYAPGATCTPTSASAGTGGDLTVATPTNADFEDDLTGWSADAGYHSTTYNPYSGTKSCEITAGAGNNLTIINDNHVPVVVGQRISASIMVAQGGSASGDAGSQVGIFWFDSSDTLISQSLGNAITSSSGGSWQRSSVNAVAPSGAAFAAIGAISFNNGSYAHRIDASAWDYAYTAPTTTLIFTAVQAAPGHSGATEPDWPTTNGVQVIDNEVVWESGPVGRITWEASPISKSGDTEPTWPTSPGDMVHDGTCDWQCVTPEITDENCPQSKIVAIVSSKVYAGDDDIIRYSATLDPTDWTSQYDAGFLPFGLQNYGSNSVAALGIYRSNLVAFNSQGFQMWQVDEDPANAALLDALPLGSTRHKTLTPVANDLFFLTQQGVRTMGISAASDSLVAGDVGMPIDPLVKAALEYSDANGITPLSTYYPSAGQFWLAFPGVPLDVFF